jgi:hypothetical protein
MTPATPHTTPLVSRSDGTSFHIFLEESLISRQRPGDNYQISALYRYDLDPLKITGDSTLVSVQEPNRGEAIVRSRYEEAVDALTAILIQGRRLRRHYLFLGGRLSDIGSDGAIDILKDT